MPREMAVTYENAVVLESLAMKALLTTIRRKSTKQAEYVDCCDRLCAMLAEEALARLPGTGETAFSCECGFDGLAASGAAAAPPSAFRQEWAE